MKNVKPLFISFILSALLLCSCDAMYTYSYKVTNRTDAEIKIELKADQVDSTFIVSINETALLFETDHGAEGARGPFFSNVALDLEKFVVVKNDTLVSSIDYLSNSAWIYNDGLYSTSIENNEFR